MATIPAFNPLSSLLSGQQARTAFDAQKLKQREVGLLSQIANKGPSFQPTGGLAKNLAAIDPIQATSIVKAFTGLSNARKRNFFQGALKARDLIKSGRIKDALDLARRNRDKILKFGGNPIDSNFIIDALSSGRAPEALKATELAVNRGVGLGFLGAGLKGRKFSFAAFVAEGKKLRDALASTTDPKQKAEIEQELRDLASRTRRTKAQELSISGEKVLQRRSSLELFGRRKAAGDAVTKRNRRNFNIRLSLQSAFSSLPGATGGVAGQAKEFFAKFIPGVNINDNATVERALTSFGLQVLQNFKGQTTDFEFRVAKSINGELKDSKTSVEQKLKLLDLMTFMSSQRDRQLKSFLGDINADPINFAFSGGKKFQGQTINDIARQAIDQKQTVEQAVASLNEKDAKKRSQASGQQDLGVSSVDAELKAIDAQLSGG